MEDTLMINHNITINGNTVDFGANWMIVDPNASLVSDTVFGLHGNLKSYGLLDIQIFAVGDGDSTLVYGDLDGVYFAPGNPNNINYGTIYSDTLVAGSPFENYGQIDVISLTSATDFTNYSGAAVNTTGQTTFATITLNEAGATMNLGSLVTSDLITNNGDISCMNWTHGSGTADGSGNYCISMCFINSATITGTLDVCDANTDFCDFQLGTISPSVTMCTAGPCADNTGIEEQVISIDVYPNPTNGVIELSVPTDLIDKMVSVVDLLGEVHKRQSIESTELHMDLNELPSGVYLLRIEDTAIQEQIIKL